MLQLLRSKELPTIIVILIYASILHIHAFVLPSDWTPQNAGLFSHWIYQYLDINSITAKLIALLLVVFQAVYVTHCVNHHKLAKSYSYFPAAFYLIYIAFFQEYPGLSPVLLGSTFLIVALMQMYKIYKKDGAYGDIFNIGFWIAIGSLFYLPVGVFLLFGFGGLAVLRSSRFNEWLVMLTGFLTPYFLVTTGFFASNQLSTFFQLQFLNNLSILDFSFPFNLQFYTRLVVLALSLLIILFGFRNYLYKQNIQTQRYINILLFSLLILGATPLFQANLQLEHFIMYCMPLSIFIGMSFLNIKTKPIAEFLFILLFISTLVWQYNELILKLLRGS